MNLVAKELKIDKAIYLVKRINGYIRIFRNKTTKLFIWNENRKKK